MPIKKLRELIQQEIDSYDSSRKDLDKEIMKNIGKDSNISGFIIYQDEQGNQGVFYDSQNEEQLRKSIGSRLEKTLKEINSNPEKSKDNQNKSKTKRKYTVKEKTFSDETKKVLLPLEKARQFIEKKYNLIISQTDLKKIIKPNEITKQALEIAYGFGMFELIPVKELLNESGKVPGEYSIREISLIDTKTNQKYGGVPRYYCEYPKIVEELLSEKRQIYKSKKNKK